MFKSINCFSSVSIRRRSGVVSTVILQNDVTSTQIRRCFYDNIDLPRKKCGISNLVVKEIKIQRLQVYIDNICRCLLVLIAHAQKSLIKAHV